MSPNQLVPNKIRTKTLIAQKIKYSSLIKMKEKEKIETILTSQKNEFKLKITTHSKELKTMTSLISIKLILRLVSGVKVVPDLLDPLKSSVFKK